MNNKELLKISYKSFLKFSEFYAKLESLPLFIKNKIVIFLILTKSTESKTKPDDEKEDKYDISFYRLYREKREIIKNIIKKINQAYTSVNIYEFKNKEISEFYDISEDKKNFCNVDMTGRNIMEFKRTDKCKDYNIPLYFFFTKYGNLVEQLDKPDFSFKSYFKNYEFKCVILDKIFEIQNKAKSSEMKSIDLIDLTKNIGDLHDKINDFTDDVYAKVFYNNDPYIDLDELNNENDKKTSSFFEYLKFDSILYELLKNSKPCEKEILSSLSFSYNCNKKYLTIPYSVENFTNFSTNKCFVKSEKCSFYPINGIEHQTYNLMLHTVEELAKKLIFDHNLESYKIDLINAFTINFNKGNFKTNPSLEAAEFMHQFLSKDNFIYKYGDQVIIEDKFDIDKYWEVSYTDLFVKPNKNNEANIVSCFNEGVFLNRKVSDYIDLVKYFHNNLTYNKKWQAMINPDLLTNDKKCEKIFKKFDDYEQDFIPKFIEKVSEADVDDFCYVDINILINGEAGSGKSEVMKSFIKTIPYEQWLILVFTNELSNKMKNDLLDNDTSMIMTNVKTIDSFLKTTFKHKYDPEAFSNMLKNFNNSYDLIFEFFKMHLLNKKPELKYIFVDEVFIVTNEKILLLSIVAKILKIKIIYMGDTQQNACIKSSKYNSTFINLLCGFNIYLYKNRRTIINSTSTTPKQLNTSNYDESFENNPMFTYDENIIRKSYDLTKVPSNIRLNVLLNKFQEIYTQNELLLLINYRNVEKKNGNINENNIPHGNVIDLKYNLDIWIEAINNIHSDIFKDEPNEKTIIILSEIFNLFNPHFPLIVANKNVTVDLIAYNLYRAFEKHFIEKFPADSHEKNINNYMRIYRRKTIIHKFYTFKNLFKNNSDYDTFSFNLKKLLEDIKKEYSDICGEIKKNDDFPKNKCLLKLEILDNVCAPLQPFIVGLEYIFLGISKLFKLNSRFRLLRFVENVKTKEEFLLLEYLDQTEDNFNLKNMKVDMETDESINNTNILLTEKNIYSYVYNKKEYLDTDAIVGDCINKKYYIMRKCNYYSNRVNDIWRERNWGRTGFYGFPLKPISPVNQFILQGKTFYQTKEDKCHFDLDSMSKSGLYVCFSRMQNFNQIGGMINAEKIKGFTKCIRKLVDEMEEENSEEEEKEEKDDDEELNDEINSLFFNN